jgi:succinate-semialdehyde dehydrogenase/glutarate-semialdehyde dehydrogenase
MGVAQACYEDDWRRRSVAQRAGIVHAAATRMRQQSDHLTDLVTLEMGKLIAEAKGEVALSADILDYYAERASITSFRRSVHSGEAAQPPHIGSGC